MNSNARPLRSVYDEIINEMGRIIAPGTSYEDLFAGSLPRLIATSSGASLQITERFDDLISEIAARLYENSDCTETHSAEEYREVVRRAFGDPLVRLDWSRTRDELAEDIAEELQGRVSNSFDGSVREYGFSCRLFEEGSFEQFSIGPVTFSNRRRWIDRSKQSGLISADVASRAMRLLEDEDLELLSGRARMYEDDLHELLLRPHRNVCTVEVRSLGKSTREKRAAETANLAITTLSLFMRSASQFHRSAFLAYDTMPRIKKVMSFARDLQILPGSFLSHHPAPPLDTETFTAFLSEHRCELDVAGEALRYGIAPDGDVRRLQISRSIRTSLTWFRRGCIDDDDRVAIVFFSSALDALCPNGKAAGITKLVCKTFQKEQTDSLWDDGPPIKRLIKDAYDTGRSRLIHGSSADVHKDWSQMRASLEQIAKSCLWGALIFFAKHASRDNIAALSDPSASK